MVKDSIFVYFSGIDEIDIEQTIESCLKNAIYPDRISFGVSLQYQQYDKKSFKHIRNLKEIHIESEDVLGVGVTRQLVSLLHSGEKYSLQIDAHMIFNKAWDEKLISYYNSAKTINNKVILSGYAPSWYRDGNEIIKENPDSLYSITLVNDNKIAHQPIVSFVKSENPIKVNNLIFYEQKAISYHFIFSEINILKDLLPDPLIIYNGDEATISLRAISRGYKVYMPSEIILWHLNKTKDNFYSKQDRHWQPMFLGKQEPRSIRETRITQDSYQRVKDIFLGNILGYYGAETKESLEEYSRYVGIDFKESLI